MSRACAASPQPMPQEDLTISSCQPDRRTSNHLEDVHAEPASCRSLAPSSTCRTNSDGHILKGNIELAGIVVNDDPGPPVDDEPVPPDISLASVGLKNSVSCVRDYYDDSEEDRPGSFDYMPVQSGHVRLIQTSSAPYDEEVRLDSSRGSSTIDSPHSDSPVTHNDRQVTEKVEAPSRKETSLLHSKHKHPCWDYMPCGQHTDDEDMEDEEDERDRRRGLSSTSSFLAHFPRPPRQVDECVSYNLTPLNGLGSTTLEHGIRENRRSASKDDSDKPEISDQVDINGNPRPLDPADYLQMRQWPKDKHPNTISAAQSSYTPITIPVSPNSTATADPNTFDRKKERRRMRLERLKGKPAEEYTGHRNFSDITEILAFVEGPNTPSKADGKSTKRKHERSKRKEHPVNGPLALEDTAGAKDSLVKVESVTPEVITADTTVYTSLKKTVHKHSVATTQSGLVDHVSKCNSELQNFLNTGEAEPSGLAIVTSETQVVTSGLAIVTSEAEFVNVSNREQTPRPANRSGNNISKVVLSSAVASDYLSSVDSTPVLQHLTDNSKSEIKKSSKAKSKKDKQDIADIIPGPISSASNMDEHTQTVAVTDSDVLTTFVSTYSINAHSDVHMEPLPEVKREDSFTEVKKRKKRPGGKDSNAAFNCQYFPSFYHSHINSGYPSHSSFRLHTSTSSPSAQVVSSIAATSTSLSSNNQIHSTRDLSPSAFPVLPGQDPALTFHSELRRNSCGDLTTDSLDSKVYDSDRESAKSLPAAHRARVGIDRSPVYPVSYARMAAAPPRNESTTTTSPTSESGVASISRHSSMNSSVTQTLSSNTDSELPLNHSNPVVTPERKATVWKGSCRERRHSIGSSPEDVVDGEKSSVSERNRQCGSQEVLGRGIVSSGNVTSKAVTTAPPAARLAHTTEGSAPKKIITPLTELVSSPFSSAQVATKPLFQNPEATLFVTSAENAIIMNSSCKSEPTATADSLCQINHSSVAICFAGTNDSQNERSNSRKHETTAQPLVTVSKQLGTCSYAENSSKTAFTKNKLASGLEGAHRNSKTKSVVFLDKRFDSSPPPYLGITFGFDSSYESKREPTSQPSCELPTQVSPSQPQSVSEVSPSVSHNLSVIQPSSHLQLPCPAIFQEPQLPCPTVSQEHSHIPSAVHETSAVSHTSPPSRHYSRSSDRNNSHVPKGVPVARPCNGLILPLVPSGKCSIPQDQVASSGDICGVECVSSSGDGAAKSGNIDNCITVHITKLDAANSVRTNQLKVSPGEVTSVSSDRNNLPISFSGLLNSTSPDSPQSQVIVSTTDVVEGNTGGTITKSATRDVPFSPTSHTLLPLHTMTPGHTDETVQQLPSARKIIEPTSECQAGLVDSVPRESANNLLTSAELEKAKDSPAATITARAPSPATDAATEPQQLKPLVLPSEMQPVVYGMKIKPNVGCGTLYFVAPSIPRKVRGQSADVSSFLAKRWLDDVVHKVGSETFITLSED